MLIRCLIERAGGTAVTMPNKDGTVTGYLFCPDKPDGSGPHVCEVSDEAHAARFLEISEAYAIVEADDKHKRQKAKAGE